MLNVRRHLIFSDVGDGWIEPEGASNNQVYYVAKDAPAMNWFDADKYCLEKGGFLAEPLTSTENDFLKAQVSKYIFYGGKFEFSRPVKPLFLQPQKVLQ